MNGRPSDEKTVRIWTIIMAVVGFLAIAAMCPYAVYIFYPGAPEAAAEFAWFSVWQIAAFVSLVISTISIVLLSKLKKAPDYHQKYRASLRTTMIFAVISLVPGAMLLLWLPALLIDFLFQITFFLRPE